MPVGLLTPPNDGDFMTQETTAAQGPTPELALALYASTASTVTAAALHKLGVLSDENRQHLIDSLTIAEGGCSQPDTPPFIAEHIDTLMKILASD
jgi:hypothetical protein